MTSSTSSLNSNLLTPVIKTDQLSKSYAHVTAIDQLSIEVHQGEMLAVLGPNGAGKTTLINLMLGRIKADKGSVSIFSQQSFSRALRTRIGTILQSTTLPAQLTVKEQIVLFSSYYPNPLAFEEIINMTGLKGLEGRRYSALSQGQQQRLSFALAISGNPDLLFLDEPTVGMDVTTRRDFWTSMRTLVSQGKTIVLTTHYLEEADALADRILVINNGKLIIEGTPQSIKSTLGGKRIQYRSQESLLELPGAGPLEKKGNFYEVVSYDCEKTTQYLLNHDATVSDLSIIPITLEEAFVHLTKTTQIA